MNNSGVLNGKTIFITGASRGIGLAIAKKLAADGANIVVAARTTEPQPNAQKTIYTAEKEIEEVGGRCLACKMDVRSEEDIRLAIEKTINTFGQIDIVINNCSALNMTPMLDTNVENYDNMYKIITRGAFLVSKLFYPHLKKSNHAHILNISPPINMNPVWLKLHMAYTAAKYSVSMYTIGMSQEFKKDNIAVNSLWPKLVIYSSGMKSISGPKAKKYCRNVNIMADAAYAILIKNPKLYTGNLVFDEEILSREGITNFEQYRADPSYREMKLFPDLFTDEVPNFNILNDEPDV